MDAVAAALLVALAVALGAACSAGGDGRLQTFEGERVSFRYPSGWHVSGFSTTVLPRRLAVASYVLPAGAVEGDCGGLAAVRALPPDGGLVILIHYGEGPRSYPPKPSRFRLRAGEFASYECFGASTMFRFAVGDRDLQAHVAFGPDASAAVRERALAILDSLELSRPPAGE